MSDEKKKTSSRKKDFVRQLIRALIVLILAVSVFILSGNEKAVKRIKQSLGLGTSAAVISAGY